MLLALCTNSLIISFYDIQAYLIPCLLQSLLLRGLTVPACCSIARSISALTIAFLQKNPLDSPVIFISFGTEIRSPSSLSFQIAPFTEATFSSLRSLLVSIILSYWLICIIPSLYVCQRDCSHLKKIIYRV